MRSQKLRESIARLPYLSGFDMRTHGSGGGVRGGGVVESWMVAKKAPSERKAKGYKIAIFTALPGAQSLLLYQIS